MRNFSVLVTIDGKSEKLIFDLNTYSAFEEVTGKFFPDFLYDLQDAVAESRKFVEDAPEGKKLEAEARAGGIIARRIPLKHLKALLWSSWHSYKNNDEPVWPYTMAQVGSKVGFQEIMELMPVLINGAVNAATTETKEPRPIRGNAGTEEIPSAPESGGTQFGPSDAEILASIDRN